MCKRQARTDFGQFLSLTVDPAIPADGRCRTGTSFRVVKVLHKQTQPKRNMFPQQKINHNTELAPILPDPPGILLCPRDHAFVCDATDR